MHVYNFVNGWPRPRPSGGHSLRGGVMAPRPALHHRLAGVVSTCARALRERSDAATSQGGARWCVSADLLRDVCSTKKKGLPDQSYLEKTGPKAPSKPAPQQAAKPALKAGIKK